MGRITLSRLHRLFRRLVMRYHIHVIIPYPQDGEPVAAIKVLLSVYDECDASHFPSLFRLEV